MHGLGVVSTGVARQCGVRAMCAGVWVKLVWVAAVAWARARGHNDRRCGAAAVRVSGHGRRRTKGGRAPIRMKRERERREARALMTEKTKNDAGPMSQSEI